MKCGAYDEEVPNGAKNCPVCGEAVLASAPGARGLSTGKPIIKATCSKCGQKVTVPAHLAGKEGACPKCGAKMRVPALPPQSPHEPLQVLKPEQTEPPEKGRAATPQEANAAPISLAASFKDLLNGPAFGRKPGPATPAEKVLALGGCSGVLLLVVIIWIASSVRTEVSADIYAGRAAEILADLSRTRKNISTFINNVRMQGAMLPGHPPTQWQVATLFEQHESLRAIAEDFSSQAKWLKGTKPPPGFEGLHANLLEACTAIHADLLEARRVLNRPGTDLAYEAARQVAINERMAQLEAIVARSYSFARYDPVWQKHPNVKLPP